MARYRHFCVLAEALEQLGDRWTLLVVRDLVAGRRRFSDLIERLGGVTPTTLAQRLRDLVARGLVEVDRVEGRREVWYQLTAKGRDLVPALEEIVAWGLRHVARPPEPGEPIHPDHVLWALQLHLERAGVRPGTLAWQLRLLDDGPYAIAHDDRGWAFHAGQHPDPAVIVTATKYGWARFLATPASARAVNQRDVEIAGSRRAVRTFLKAIAAFPAGVA